MKNLDRPSTARAPATLFGIGPFDHLVARGAVAEATSAAAWLQAQLDVEAALAVAQSTVGEIPRDAAEAITARAAPTLRSIVPRDGWTASTTGCCRGCC